MIEIVFNFLNFSVSLCISEKKDQETSKVGAVITKEGWGGVFDPNKTTTRKPSRGGFVRVT